MHVPQEYSLGDDGISVRLHGYDVWAPDDLPWLAEQAMQTHQVNSDDGSVLHCAEHSVNGFCGSAAEIGNDIHEPIIPKMSIHSKCLFSVVQSSTEVDIDVIQRQWTAQYNKYHRHS